MLGIRPEHLLLGAQPGFSQLEAEVDVTEPTGTETLLNVSAKGISLLAVFKQRLDFGPGDRITLSIDPKLVHVFDKATGHRL